MGGRADRRPDDADRDRYTKLLDAARAEGRIDGAELSRRAFTVRYAQTVGELDAVVDDLPHGPAGAGAGRSPTSLIVVAATVVAVGIAGLVGLIMRSDDSASSSEDAAVVEEQSEPEVVDMFTVEELTRMMDQLEAERVPGYVGITIFPDRVHLETQVTAGARQYDRVTYEGTLGPFEPYSEVTAEDPADEFFTADDVDVGVVAAIAAGAAQVAGYEGRPVSHIMIGRNVFYGDVVTIAAYLESDAYGSGAALTWDSTGQHLLDDGANESRSATRSTERRRDE